MKVLKYIGIGILVILAFVLGPALATGFGACAFLGFCIIGGLDAIGLVKINTNDSNTLALISFGIGFVLFLIYFSILGFPK